MAMCVRDTSENGTANLGTDIKMPNPVHAGDTLYAESEIPAFPSVDADWTVG